MKKLENIPKKEIFNVPDGYFEGLPARIQARISKENPVSEPSFIFRYKLQYALPVIALLALGIFWFTPKQQPADVDTLLASIETEDLVAFVGETDITNYDILESVEVNATDVTEIEGEVYELNLDVEQFDGIMEELDLDNL
jgi:hypothetical protein